jgi:anti-sigma factor RsiW
VSLLERLGRGHLTDQQFARLWAAGDRHPHLDACAGCRTRFAAFDAWLIGVGETLRVEADEAFPAERLAAQQAQIARRLKTLERPARVIAFPKAARAVISGNSHVRRWVTVAAAASLITGITGFGLGQIVPLRTAFDRRVATGQQLTAPEAARRAEEIQLSTSPKDEELLSDSFVRPRVRDLSALDDMTPHARDAAK